MLDKDRVVLSGERIPTSEYDERFLQGMINRMGVSYHKYGEVKDAYPGVVDAIESLLARVQKYKETGNTEWLIDAANFAMIEFMCPGHPDAHYRPTDSREAPGRKLVTGQTTRDHNFEAEDKVRRSR